MLNPRSTRADPRALRGVVDALESGGAPGTRVEVAQTTGRGHARDLAAAVRTDDVNAVVVMAGDGTVGEVVDGLLTAGPGTDVPALGLVPAGGTNVLARTLGQPLGTLGSAQLVARALREGSSRRLGLVHMTVTEVAGRPVADRWVVLNAGLGLDALAIARVEAARTRGHRATSLRYAASTVKAWCALDRTATPMSLTSPLGSVTRLPMVIITNTDPWSYLGPHRLRPTPQASFDLGIDVSAPRGLEAHQVVQSLGRMLSGRPAGTDRTYTAHDLAWVHVSSTQEVALQADGDYLGRVLGVRLTAVPKALEVLTADHA